jgi:hypothetical protein
MMYIFDIFYLIHTTTVENEYQVSEYEHAT